MGKRKKSINICLFALMWLLLVFTSIPVRAEATTDIQIEQVRTKMPELKAYIIGEDVSSLKSDQIEACLGDEKLSVKDIRDFSKSGEGIQYYVLLDISLSISEEDFQAMKDAVYGFVGKLGDKDQATVITFGDEVSVFWTDAKGKKSLKKKLSSLTNDNMNTQLYEALIQASDLCSQNGNTGRKVAIVLSDGLDDIKGKSTRNETVEKLTHSSLPVYGIAVGDDNEEGVNRFGELIRTGHGRLLLADEGTVSDKLQQLAKTLKSARILWLEGASNIVSQDVREIKFQFKQYNLVSSIYAGFYQWTPDETVPEMQDVEQIGDNQIQVSFSEPVDGMEHAANFEMKSKAGKLFVPQGASIIDDKTVKLTFGEDFYEGNYTLTCNNIYDISMEKNKVSDSFIFSLKGKRGAAVTAFFIEWGWLCAVCLAVVLGIILVTILILHSHKDTEKLEICTPHQPSNAGGRKKGKRLTFFISTAKERSYRMERNLADSMIVGRSQICEICINDTKMSKQHFALEYKDGNIYIMDLESTNGTKVNDVRIIRKQKLNNYDKISAGNTTICIKW